MIPRRIVNIRYSLQFTMSYCKYPILIAVYDTIYKYCFDLKQSVCYASDEFLVLHKDSK